jgi:transcriptional regulator with XRE-family HTH domain
MWVPRREYSSYRAFEGNESTGTFTISEHPGLFEYCKDDELAKNMDPGARLKAVRTKLGITTREVAVFSKTISEAEGNDEFLISSPWLTQIENEKAALPSIYKLFTLASIYGLSYTQVLAFYGIDTRSVKKYHAELPIAKTHLTEYDSADSPATLEIPVRFDAGLNLSHTNLLSRMIESWGKVPIEFIQHFDLRHRLYGFVGLKDYTLYPLLRPGSFVEIDPDVKKPRHGEARSEFDRPIYFVDLRNEYVCSWCELVEDKLVLLAHPLSPVKTRMFAYQKEAEIIGQVTGVAMRIVLSLVEPGGEISKAP